MAKMQDVALFFIDLANEIADQDGGDGMTNLRLQKLLYFAQGYYYARYGEMLFDAGFEAWPLGPVVPESYRQYSPYGRNFIPTTKKFDRSTLTEQEFNFLMDFIAVYGDKSTSALISESHAEDGPWHTAAMNGFHAPMSDEEIQQYFKGKEPISSFDALLDHYPVMAV